MAGLGAGAAFENNEVPVAVGGGDGPAVAPTAGGFGPEAAPAAGGVGPAAVGGVPAAAPAAVGFVPSAAPAAGGFVPAAAPAAAWSGSSRGFAPVAGGLVPAAAPAAGGFGPAAAPAAGGFVPAACPAAAAPAVWAAADVPPAVLAAGGYLATVRVPGLTVLDVYPPAYRWSVPSQGRVQWELRQLRDASAGQRALRLIKMAYWPKLLEQVLRREKAKSQREQGRLREMERRRRQGAKRFPLYGCTTGVAQVNDTDLHQELRRCPASAAPAADGFVLVADLEAGVFEPDADPTAAASAAAADPDSEDSVETEEDSDATDVWSEYDGMEVDLFGGDLFGQDTE